MPKKYQAIIFDLGGVLYDIDTQYTADAFHALGLRDFQNVYTLKAQAGLIDALEKGQITEAGFVEGINRISPVLLSPDDIKTAWNALLLGMPGQSVDILLDLKQRGYRLYLLSNTNVYHYNHINQEMNTRFGYPDLAGLFDRAYYSFLEGMRKPDPEIYLKLMQENHLSPETTIFIDDNEDNIRGAQNVGIPALLKPKEISLEALLKSVLH